MAHVAGALRLPVDPHPASGGTLQTPLRQSAPPSSCNWSGQASMQVQRADAHVASQKPVFPGHRSVASRARQTRRSAQTGLGQPNMSLELTPSVGAMECLVTSVGIWSSIGSSCERSSAPSR
jgi:hypothetical protein